MRPVIGLTHSIELAEDRLHTPLAYPAAVEAAGGTPILLPATADDAVMRQYLSLVDGLLLTGGDDVDPQCYGEDQIWQCGDICPMRDRYELQLVRLAIDMKKPIFGICRGLQLLNVALGGTLYQDLHSQKPDSICHGQKQRPFYTSHQADVADGSRLHKLFGGQIAVNSHHHQAIKDLGEGLTATATAPDGVIEAVEGTADFYCVALQWHPELLVQRTENAAHKALFTDFVNACRK